MRARGFTLIEIAVTIFIIALLSASMIGPMRAYITQRYVSSTQISLTDINDALIGFASSQGRLPCPATVASAGVEVCGGATDGLVPALTIGMASTGGNGTVLDAWANPIRYSVHPSYTTTANLAVAWKTSPPPGLLVCSTVTGTTATTCPAPSVIAGSAPSVVYSTGINGNAAASPDELANLDGNVVFISRTRTDAGTTATEFDDMLVWTSPYLLFSKMIAAGLLP